MIPMFSATKPRIEVINAIIPQQKPFMKPEIILLYSGRTFCAQTKITGWASMVTNPINAKSIIENIGNVLYVKANMTISGNVPNIEKYMIGFEPNLFSIIGLSNEPIAPAKTNKNRDNPM